LRAVDGRLYRLWPGELNATVALIEATAWPAGQTK
jgi:hypothetical protein